MSKTPVSRNYLQYLFKSKGRHGVHSAFVFDFVDKCLTTKVDKNFISQRKMWVKNASYQTETFTITDLGAGSKKMKNTRSVSQLIKTASTNGIYGDVLWKIAHHYRPKNILELGTSIGTGAITMKNATPESFLITVEGCEQILRRAYQQFDYWQLKNIVPIHASFDEFLKLPNVATHDLVFLDGNHESTATLSYLELLLNQTHNETIFILDDIRWSDDMWSLWQKLIADDRFHLTIDLGRMGLIWKRPHQMKEHFVLRPQILKTKLF